MIVEIFGELLAGVAPLALASGSESVAGAGGLSPAQESIAPVNSFFDGMASLVRVVAGSAAVLFFGWGAIQYMAAATNSQQADRAKGAMAGAVAGLALVMLAPTIVDAIELTLPSVS